MSKSEHDDIVTWGQREFYIPDAIRAGRRRHPGPIILTEVQKRILLHCFTKDAEGKFPYDTIVWSTPKKEGKTTIGALVCEWYGSSQEPPNEIYIVANTEKQAVGRVYRTLLRSVRLNPSLRPYARLSDEQIVLPNDTLLQPLASNPNSVSGSNHGLVEFDELWSYKGESFRLLYDELTQVPTRENSLHFITTYAGFEGVSELLWELYLRGVSKTEHPEGQGEKVPGLADLPCYRNGRLFVYWDHENRAPWKSQRWLDDQRRKFKGRPSGWLRFYENRWATAEETFIEPEKWDKCIPRDEDGQPTVRPLLPTNKIPLFIGIDAASKRDTTAVVATYYDNQAKKVRLAFHRIWTPQPGVDFDLDAVVGEYLIDVRAKYNVRLIRADPNHLHQTRINVGKRGVVIEEFKQTIPNLTAASQQLFDLLDGLNLEMYPDEELRAQMLGAVAVVTPGGWKIAKEKSSAKVDAMVALAISAYSAVQLGAFEERPDDVGVEMPFKELAKNRRDPALDSLPIQLGGRRVVVEQPVRRLMIFESQAPDVLDLAVAKLGGRLLTDGREQGYVQALGGYVVHVTGNAKFVRAGLEKRGLGRPVAGPFEVPEQVGAAEELVAWLTTTAD